MNKHITRWFVIFLLSWFIVFSSVNSAVPALVMPVARAIITHPEVKKRAIQLLLALGGRYVLHLTHKDGITNISDMNCGINGTVSKGPSIQQVEQGFKEHHKYVNLWYSGKNGKYNVYGINYGESEQYAYLVSVWCGGPNELDDDNIIVNAEPASQDILEQAELGNVQAQDFIKFVQEVAREEAEAKAKAKEKEKEEEEDKKKKCLPVTEPNIRMVLEPTTELTTQESVSLPVIAIYVARIENGEPASQMKPIELDGNIVVNGHHRFISAKLCRQEPPRTKGTLAPSRRGMEYPLKNIMISPNDFGNR